MSSTGVPVSVGPFYGAIYFSAIICTGFYGVICMQTFIYFVRNHSDPLSLKGLVVILWALNTVHEALTISGAYKYIRAGLEDPLVGFFYPIPDLVLGMLLTTLISLSTQGFFIYRIYRFGGKSLIAPLVWIPLALYQLVATLLYVGKALFISNGGLQAVDLTTLGDTFFTDISVSYCAVTAGVDILIAISMTVLLVRRMQTATAYRSTSKLLQRLMMFAIVSGIWTAVFALLAAILVRVYSSTFIYTAFAVPLCSLYCNTLLANLNARTYIRGDVPDHATTDLMTTVWTKALDGTKQDGEPGPSSSNDRVIWKTTEVVTFSDINEPRKPESL